jgi:oligopeptide transport system substrate-binding protein
MIRCLYLLFLVLMGCTRSELSNEIVIHSFLDANVPHLDPIHSTNKYSSTINSAIFEGLYSYHYFKTPLELQPSLAETLPIISADRKTYTITLKKGVLFQDDPAFPDGKGRELVADDVVFSWKRLADPTNKALGWWVFDDLIVGLNTWRDLLRRGKASYATPVQGLKVIDRYTLQIQLTRPSHNFIHILAMPPTMVVAPEVVRAYGKEIVNHPVGTGPFALKNWTRNSKVELEKNPNYRPAFFPNEGWDESQFPSAKNYAGKPLPLADKVIVSIFRETQPLWLSFLKGDLDHGSIPKENVNQVFSGDKLSPFFEKQGLRILTQHRPDVTYITFNMEHSVLGAHKDLRKALAHALDKQVILDKFYNSRGLVAHGPIPPGIDGYDPQYENRLDYDLEKAKNLLAQAGFPGGQGLPVFDYQMPNVSSWSRQFSEYLKEEWGKIGVKIKLEANTWPQFDKKLKTKQASIFDMAWMADYPDSENFLQLFYSRNISPGPNNANFINRHYDDLYLKAQKLPPGYERNQVFKQMVEFINEEVPSIFLIHRFFRLPFHPWLKNYNETPLVYDYYKYLTIDLNEKKKIKSTLKKP